MPRRDCRAVAPIASPAICRSSPDLVVGVSTTCDVGANRAEQKIELAFNPKCSAWGACYSAPDQSDADRDEYIDAAARVAIQSQSHHELL